MGVLKYISDRAEHTARMRIMHRAPVKQPTKLAISMSEGTHIVQIDDIIRCQAESNYCRIYLKDGRSILTSKTLKSECRRCCRREKFVRVHQSHLVNNQAIKLITSAGIQLNNNFACPVSRSSFRHHTSIANLLPGCAHV